MRLPGTTNRRHGLFSWECTPSGTGPASTYILTQFETKSQGRKLDKLAGGLLSLTTAELPLLAKITSIDEGREVQSTAARCSYLGCVLMSLEIDSCSCSSLR